jgi:Ca2+-binding RTX toxin-like protein
MAKVFLDPNDVSTVSDNNVSVFGTSGDEVVKINQGVTGLVVDQNVERVQLPGESSEYKFLQAGNQIKVYAADGTTLLATIPLQGDSNGTQLTFVNGTVDVKLAAGGVMTFGGATVSNTTAGTLTATTIDTSLVTPDTTPRFSVVAGASSATEGGNATFTVNLTVGQGTLPASTYTVDLALTGTGGAELGTDTGAMVVSGTGVTLSGSTLTFAPGATSATITVPVTPDLAVETGEGLSVALSNPGAGSALRSGQTTAATSLLDPPIPEFSIAAGAASAVENTSATFTISLSAAQTLATSVDFTLAGTGGATIGTDTGAVVVSGTGVTVSGSTVTFAPGATTATITVPVAFDTVAESGEGISVTLSNAVSGTQVSGTASVANTALTDPPAPSFTLTSDAAGTPTQEGHAITFTVTPSGVVTSDTTLTINLTGATVGSITSQASAADFNPNSTTLTFKAGETAAKTTSVTVVSDSTSEGIEGYKASLLDSGFNEKSSITGTINDPVPSLTLTQSTGSVDEDGTVVYTVTSDITAPTGGITIPYTLSGTTTAGTDFTGGSTGTITIAAGATAGSLSIRPTADNATEGSETIIVTLGTPNNGTVSVGTVTTTVNDTSKALDPTQFALAGAASVDEGSSVTYTLTYGSAATSDMVVPYTLTGTATNATDYTGSTATGNFTIKTGSTSATVTLSTVADGLTEGAETVVMTLGTLPSGTTAVTGKDAVTTTINDTSVTVTGQTYSLTTSVDNITGTANNDTVYGTLSYASGVRSDATNTFNVGDIINGGAGNDTFNITVSGTTTAASSYTAFNETMTPSLTGVERVLVSNTLSNLSSGGTGSAVYHTDLSLADSSLTVLGTAASTDVNTNTAFDNVGKMVDVEMRGRGDLAVNFTSAVTSGTGDALNLTLNGVGASGSNAIFDTDNVETLNITSSTAANYLELGTDASTGWSELTKVNVSGSQTLDLNLGTGASTVATVSATGNTAGVTVTGITADKFTVTGGVGNDTFNFSSGFNASGTGSSILDNVAGGSGTDTLVIGSGSYADGGFTNVSSVETLSLGSGTTVTLDAKAAAAGITTVTESVSTGALDTISLTISSGFTNALTVQLYGTGATGNDTVLGGSANVNLTVKADAAVIGTGGGDLIQGATGTGTTDTLILTVQGTGTAVNLGTGFTNFETITLAANSASGITLTTDTANVSSGKTLAIDGSALTNSSANIVFTGTGETDGGKFNITGGAGNDTFYLGAGNDTVSGGTGNDSIDGSAGGNDSLAGGVGNDTFTMGSGLGSGDTIDGGDGTGDTLVVTASSVSSADFLNVSNVEILQLNASTVTLTGSIPFTTFDLTNTGVTTLTLGAGYSAATTVNLGSGDSLINTAGVALTVNVTEANAGTTLAMTGGTGTDTVNITAGSGTSTISLATGAKIDVINVVDGGDGTGAGADLILSAAGYTSTLKVDASGLDAGGTGAGLEGSLDETLNFTASGATANVTVLGGGGADTIIGGNANDSLDGGAGNDVLVSGTGFDNIAGGDGNDRIIFGLATGGSADGLFDGNDTVAGGSGTDTLVVTQGTGGIGDLAFLNVSGVEVLELGTGAGTVTLDSRAQTAGVATVKLGDAATNYTVSAAGYTGAMTFDLNSNTGNVSLAGGTNNDVFVVTGTTVLGSGDSLVGGNGTDTIRLDNGLATGASSDLTVTLGAGASGIEAITVNDPGASGSGDVTINFSGYSATGTLTIDASALDANSSGGTGLDEVLFLNASSLSASQVLSVTGGAGTDSITAGAGNDTISGGAGNDTITGGQGSDSLTGGAGNDVFAYSALNQSYSTTADTISDFTLGSDTFDVSGGSFSKVAFAGNVSTYSNAGTVMANTAGQSSTLAVFVQDTKQLWIDWNQDGVLQGGSDLLISLPNATGLSGAAFASGGSAIVGTSAADNLVGTSADDIIFTMNTGAGTGSIDTVNGGSGNDLLLLNQSTGSAGDYVVVTGVETIKGGYGLDYITLSTVGQTVTLTDANSTGMTVTGSTGADTIIFGNSTGGQTITLVDQGGTWTASGSTGADTLLLGTGGGTSTGTISGIESFSGSAGSDALTIAATGSMTGINLGSGNDTLIVSFSTGSLTATGVGSAGTDTLLLTGTGNIITIDDFEVVSGTTGADTIVLGGTGGLSVTVTDNGNGFTLSGSTGADTVIIGSGNSGTLTFADTGGGFTASGSDSADTVVFTSSSASSLVFNLGSGNDSLTVSGNLDTGSYTGGAGTDTLVLAGTGTAFTIDLVETVSGSTGSDVILLGTTGNTVTLVDAGGTMAVSGNASGADILIISNSSSGTLLILADGTGMTVTGSDNSDTVAFTSSSATGLVFSLGSGNDSLSFSGGADFATFSGGSGTDTLVLVGTGNTITIDSVETVTGSTGADTILLASTGSDIVSLGGGTGSITTTFSSWGSGDTINLGSGLGADTLVFGTGFATGGIVSLSTTNFSATGSDADVLNLDAIVTATGSANVYLGAGGTGYNVSSGNGVADLNVSGSGYGVILVTSTGNTFGTGDIAAATGGTGGDLFLNTGNSYVIALSTGTGDATIDLYYVNAGIDGTTGSYSNADIVKIDTVTLINGAVQDLTTANFVI